MYKWRLRQSDTGPSYWVRTSYSLGMAFSILDDRRILSCSWSCDRSVHETDQRAFKNKIGSAECVSSPGKNNFAFSLPACFHGNYFSRDWWFYADAAG